MKERNMFARFFKSESSSGIILIACTIASLVIANFFAGPGYFDFWHQKLGFTLGSLDLNLSVEHWINDGLMTIFFLMVGLEIERELYIGELAGFRKALLPIMAALGGMVVPALIHFALNGGTPTQSGFGIPMATDIAFAIGILALAGKHVPVALKIFLTALAIIDDIGAIIIIALFYTEGLEAQNLFISLGVLGLLFVLSRLKVYSILVYSIGGIIAWYFMLRSGVHATITGVLLAFVIPFGSGSKSALSERLQSALHIPVAFLIVPLFAFTNTGIILSGSISENLLNRNSLGIMAGLFIGKPVGILLFCYAAVKTRMAQLPYSITWLHLLGAGIIAGIGFTMSIFITLLAFNDPEVITQSKMAILAASTLAGVCGYFVLRKCKRPAPGN